jgi:predicted kinase
MTTLKVIFCKGIPGSGKSFWAKSQVDKDPDNWVRVNKDDLRKMILNDNWNKEREKYIEKIEESLVWQAFDNKKNVIIDNTHLSSKHEERYRKLVDEWNYSENNGLHKYELEVKFFDVSLQVALIRNAGRPNPVPEKRIRQMYNQHIRPLKEATVPRDPALLDCIICDIDGTLALLGGRNAYDRDFINDEINGPVRKVLEAFTFEVCGELVWDGQIILVSGRSDKYKDETKEWLKKHNIQYDNLYMRKDGDVRSDIDVKTEIYQKEIIGQYNVLFVLDDRKQVVEGVWRKFNLPTFQVAEGEF